MLGCLRETRVLSLETLLTYPLLSGVFLSGGFCGSGRGLGLERVGETLDNQWILCVKGVQLKSLGLDFGDRWGRACSAKIVWNA